MGSVKIMPPVEILQLLRLNPDILAELAIGIPSDLLGFRPEPDEWSVLENLMHIYSCEVVWGKRITDMINDDHPTLHALNPVTWQKRNDLSGYQFWSLFSKFT